MKNTQIVRANNVDSDAAERGVWLGPMLNLSIKL